jgi:signal transduction histidine kinase/ActR/RegA family two-component response regulator
MRPEDLIGKTTFDITYPEDHHVLTGSQQSILERRPSPPLVTRVPHSQGGLRWFESKVTPFTASNGAGRALVMSRDITERVHEDLGRDLLYRVVQETTDLIAVCTPDTTLRFANQTAVQLLAPEADESLEGKSLYDFLAPPDAYRLREEILPKLRPDQPWTGSLELVRPDGGEPLSTAATIFLFQGTDETKRSYLAVTLRDETRRRGAEEALRESELRLGQAQKMEAVGRLAGGIAHDFNNLLTAIIGYGDLVLGELDPNQAAWRDTEEILRAAERAGELTRQLLAFSRRQVLTTDPVDLNAIVADIDRMIRRLIGEDIEIVTLQNGELEGVVADRGQLEQVIVNLVVNARDAMPQGGRLTLETLNQEVEQTREVESGPLEPGPYVVLRITDTGIGMDPDTLERIFEPFFTTKEVDQGTGLGLATVYGIVSQSGGQIDIESEIGRGTTFSIYLPSSTQTTENAPPTDLGEPPGGDETILLVEDSAPVRRLVERTLANKGYQVLAAESATAALRHCARHEGPIDLLLCDVVLPRTPGPEVAARTLEMRPGTRVLYISGFSEDVLSQHGIERGDPRLLPKPFTPAQLLHALRAQLDTES